ncbi:malate dehydrogenase [Kaarinaea lacus]
MKKISIIGSGQVGQATAQMLARENFCSEITLIGRRPGLAEGAALDIQHAIPIYESNAVINGSHDYSALTGSHVVVVTAGNPRKPGMSRSDLLDTNKKIIDVVVENITKYAPDAFVVIVTNPVDILTYHTWRLSGWGKNRIMGLSCVLDSARMASMISLKTGYSAKEISALVVGGHGDFMVPLPRFSRINGIPLEVFLNQAEIDEIIAKTRVAGGDIVALKQTSGFVAAAASIVSMLDAVINDRNHILACVSVLEGEYGYSDIAIGVPTLISGSGIARIIELPLNQQEQLEFDKSAADVKDKIKHLY